MANRRWNREASIIMFTIPSLALSMIRLEVIKYVEQLSRNEALDLVEVENRPRYQNIKWYLDTLNLDYRSVGL